MEIFLLSLHVVFITYLIWNIFYAYLMGFDWMIGKKETLNKSKVEEYHKNIWLGTIAMIISGSLMFTIIKSSILYPQFYIKSFFALAIIVNGFVIQFLSKIAINKSFASLSWKEKTPLIICAAVSFVSWFGAFISSFSITN